jgi:hypothetical protein
MATLDHQSTGYTGTNITFAAAGTGTGFDVTAPSERVFLWVKNADAASRTVTVDVAGSTFEQLNPDVAVVVPNGQERMIGPLNAGLVGPTGAVVITYSALTNVTVAAVNVSTPPPDLP